MTQEELEYQIEEQNKQIEAAKKEKEEMVAKQAEYEAKIKEQEEVVKKVGEYKPEDLVKMQEAAKQFEELRGKYTQLEQQVKLDQLKSRYPLIQDWSLVPAGDEKTMEDYAAKLNKQLEGYASSKKKEEDGSNPGDQFSGIKVPINPHQEVVKKEEQNKSLEEMKTNMKNGDALAVMDNCFNAQKTKAESLLGGVFKSKENK